MDLLSNDLQGVYKDLYSKVDPMNIELLNEMYFGLRL